VVAGQPIRIMSCGCSGMWSTWCWSALRPAADKESGSEQLINVKNTVTNVGRETINGGAVKVKP